MNDIVHVPPLPARTFSSDIVRAMTLSDSRLANKNNQWRAAAWQMLINRIAITQPELGMPPFEVVRVSFDWQTHDGGRLVAAVRPVRSPSVNLVLVYLHPEREQPQIICREAVGDEFAKCLDPLTSSEPINGTQLAAIEVRATPSRHNWSGTNDEYAQDWLTVHNDRVADPQQLPVERFTLVRAARPRRYTSDHSWLVAHVRSERSGIDMVLEYRYGSTREVIACRLPGNGELGWSNFPAL